MATNKTLERELQLLIKEYEKLRDEIVNRLRIQKDIERSQILLIGIFVAAAGWIWDKEIYSLLLIASAVFFIIGTAFFEQDINIALLAGYLHRVLRPNILRFLATPQERQPVGIMEWEHFRHQEFLRTALSTILTINRTLLTYIPGFVTFATYIFLKYYKEVLPRTWDEIEIVLLFVNVVLAIFLVRVGTRVPQLYRDITEMHAKS